MLSVKRDFTAVFAIKDDIAIGVMKAIIEEIIRVVISLSDNTAKENPEQYSAIPYVQERKSCASPHLKKNE